MRKRGVSDAAISSREAATAMENHWSAVAASRLSFRTGAHLPMLTHGATCCRRFATNINTNAIT